MSTSLDIHFLDASRLTESGTVLELVHVFLDANFIIRDFEIDRRTQAWDSDPQAMQRLLALAYKAHHFSFTAWSAEWRLEISQYAAWGVEKMGREGRAFVVTTTDNTPYFMRPEYDPAQYSQFFLGIAKALYDVLAPTFGWVDFHYGLHTTHEDIEALSLPALYWANFFGPRYVEKLGRAKILNAPSWNVEELPDGGILYLVAPYPADESQAVPVDKVKIYFGISRVR